MTYLVTSDLHFSENNQDRHRFGLFLWLAEQQGRYKPQATMVLGDCTQNKDRHSATLVNSIIEGLLLLKPPVFLLEGNHDYIQSDLPFFKFLSNLPGIKFLTEITKLPDYKLAMIPHQPNQQSFDKACRKVPQKWGIMTHQTFSGAIAETGTRLSGLATLPIEEINPRLALSGDIHKPQRVGPVTYVGAPYHVRFGDNFTPRVLLVDDDGKETNLYFECPRKLVLNIRDAEEIETNKMLRPKDQVKVVLELTKEEVVEWAMHKEAILNACHNRQLEVFGVELKVNSGIKRERVRAKSKGRSNEEYFREFCLTEKVPSQVKEAGNKLLGG